LGTRLPRGGVAGGGHAGANLRSSWCGGKGKQKARVPRKGGWSGVKKRVGDHGGMPRPWEVEPGAKKR